MPTIKGPITFKKGQPVPEIFKHAFMQKMGIKIADKPAMPEEDKA